jgi:hypothetical protein
MPLLFSSSRNLLRFIPQRIRYFFYPPLVFIYRIKPITPTIIRYIATIKFSSFGIKRISIPAINAITGSMAILKIASLLPDIFSSQDLRIKAEGFSISHEFSRITSPLCFLPNREWSVSYYRVESPVTV